MLGIALTGVCVGICWLGVAIAFGVSMGRAVKLADQRATPQEPEIAVPDDLSSLEPLLGVVRPREPEPDRAS